MEGCQFLSVFPRTINMKSLNTLSFRYCQGLRNFPEIMGEMKSLKCLDLTETAIKELPSSIRYLSNLERLNLSGCWNLTDVPCSIYKLQHLQCLYLPYCPNLDTFPSKSSQSLPSLTSTKSTRLHANHSSSYVNLNDCKGLLKISGASLDVSNNISSGKLSRLSDILEGNESKMMNLYSSQRLCGNVARDVTKMKKNLVNDDEQVPTLLSLILSCQKPEFQFVFSGSQVPKWFSCRKDFIDDPEYSFTCEFCIEFPRNFKWGDKGLALCIAAETSLDVTRIVRAIQINQKLIYQNPANLDDVSVPLHMSSHVWVYYITFPTIIRRLGESGLPPPYMCRIRFEFEYYDVVESCGVHVVMPQHEDVSSMEVIVHEVDNGNSSFSEEDNELISSEDEDLRNVYSSQNDDHHDQEAMNPQKRKAINCVEPYSCQ